MYYVSKQHNHLGCKAMPMEMWSPISYIPELRDPE